MARKKKSRRAHGDGGVCEVERTRKRKDGTAYVYKVWE